jgi:hypothetical protein
MFGRRPGDRQDCFDAHLHSHECYPIGTWLGWILPVVGAPATELLGKSSKRGEAKIGLLAFDHLHHQICPETHEVA